MAVFISAGTTVHEVSGPPAAFLPFMLLVRCCSPNFEILHVGPSIVRNAYEVRLGGIEEVSSIAGELLVQHQLESGPRAFY